jgi:hypothetical protein
MTRLLALILAFGLTAPAQADDIDPLAEYAWLARPLVIFADRPDDPRFLRQIELLEAYPDDLAERDIVVLTDSDPDADGPLRERLHPRDFSVVLIDKDGSVVLRKSSPWSVRELSHAIDKTPIRQDEVLEKLGK